MAVEKTAQREEMEEDGGRGGSKCYYLEALNNIPTNINNKDKVNI